MRIVAHNGARIWGGAERATVLLLAGLKRRGHDVTLLCNSELVARNAAERGVPSEICVVGGDIVLHHVIRLSRALERLRPDAFIIGTYKKLFHASLAARIAGVKRVVARIGLETDTPRSLKYRFALRHWVDGVAVNARKIAPSFAAVRGFGSDRVTVIWNGVESRGMRGDYEAARRELGIPASAFVVGSVGRLARQKRFDRLIRALEILPEIHCVIVGDGPRGDDVRSLVTDLGLEERVHLAGEQSDASRYLDAMDVFAVASDTEGLSNAMLEAMSRGLPVVSTRVSGAEDALLDEGLDAAGIVTGFTPEALAAGIARLRDDPSLRARMASAAVLRADRLFSLDAMLDKWEAFLAKESDRR